MKTKNKRVQVKICENTGFTACCPLEATCSLSNKRVIAIEDQYRQLQDVLNNVHKNFQREQHLVIGLRKELVDAHRKIGELTMALEELTTKRGP